MPYFPYNRYPYSNFHDLNLDWILETIQELYRRIISYEGSATPYESDPRMDGTADPGNADQFARGDHRHPTDTTRASVEALQVVKDSVPGPSNGLPRMDGEAYSGFYDNYSRADHVHPSDTSKLNKAGDTMTGDFILEGYFLPKTQKEFKAVNSIGWLRIADVPNVPGSLVVFRIVRKGDVAPSETHEINLRINQNTISFENEFSKSDVLYIDQIRYTNAGKVDIHIDQNYASDVGVQCEMIGPTAAATEAIKLIPFSGVSVNPPGETPLATYTLKENTTIGAIDISSSFTKNANIEGLTAKLFAIYDQANGIVNIDFAALSDSATFGTSTPIFTCNNPKYTPTVSKYGTGMIRLSPEGTWYPYEVLITASGNIAQTLTSSADRIYGHITYHV